METLKKQAMKMHDGKKQPLKVVSYARPNLAHYCLILMIFVSVGRAHELVPGLQAMPVGKITFFLAVIVLLFYPKKSVKTSKRAWQLNCLYCVILIGMLSIPGSYWPGQSFSFFLSGFLNSLVIVWLMVKFLDSYRVIMTFVWGLILTVFLLSGSALFLNSVSERLSIGVSYDANDLAFIAVIFLPLMYFMSKMEVGYKKILLLFFCSISLATIILTQSRGGLLGVIVITAVTLMFERVRIGKIAFLGVIVFCVFSFFAPAEYWDRMSTILEPAQDYNLTSADGRIEVWKRGGQLMMDHPLLGVGLAAFPVAEGATHSDAGGKWSTAHNSFVQIGAELGIAGLLIFVLMIFLSIKSLRVVRRTVPRDSRMMLLANAVEVGFYGYLVTGFFLSQAYSNSLVVLVGLSVVLSTQTQNLSQEFCEDMKSRAE